ncbi:hypothetical protein GCM10022223_11210 [Kineosporia mesophila]|uniref:Cation/H+ exchanger transmembrane domain-containing protein n=1 Tax=Kineosporia mesophila TaxID=566012 RepID=A0ABP6Z519_9ACTN|nr:cation:proton antiporter [Kineosporia mesophila]MCD5352598.1 cation:proton antiporter [Kineosporia mesophila]
MGHRSLLTRVNDHGPPTAASPLALPALALTLGMTAGWLLPSGQVLGSGWYPVAGALLVCLGLYCATSSIDPQDLRRDWKLVLVAVTVGVVAKAALVAGALYLVLREPWAIVLGIAVAQIDPLSVEANRRRSQLSGRAKGILDAWASFDDPVTALLTIYVAGWAASLDPPGSSQAVAGTTTPWAALLGSVGIVLIAAALSIAWQARHNRRRSFRIRLGPPLLRQVPGLIALTGLIALATAWSAFLGIAVCGVLFRPVAGRYLERVPKIAFTAAALVVGLVLADSMSVMRELDVNLPAVAGVLAVAAYGAHILVSIPITRGRDLSGRDRVRLSLAQQNGITAVVLALVLEERFPGTVGIVALAVPVVAALNALGNHLWDRFEPAPGPQPLSESRLPPPPHPASSRKNEQVREKVRR